MFRMRTMTNVTANPSSPMMITARLVASY
jgi:hypothetical protein